jgi:hypothetical protein
MMVYSDWLKDQIKDHVHDIKNFNKLLDNLDLINYRWRFVMDENRALSGENLRKEYSYISGVFLDDVREGPASVFEVLVGVARNMAEQTEIETGDMFWLMMRNLGLDKLTDDVYNWRVVERVINPWLDGEFSPNGKGSPFPLKDYEADATHLDLYSQMNIYIHENFNKGGGLR